jgi:5-methylcytosine-specific restriction endonuclease McrA
MAYSEDRLNDIYDKTDGRCHLCGKKLAFKNYGVFRARGSWEVEHSVAKAIGGTDRLNNLYPAHISCNRSKGRRSSRSVRTLYGRTRAPLSRQKKDEVRNETAALGGLIGISLGGLVKGYPGAVLGGLIGAWLGHSEDPDPE